MVAALHAHISAIELGRYTTDLVQDNRDLRIKYILNDIDEAVFKKLIQLREKNVNKKQDILMVLQMFLTTSADVMRNFVEDVGQVKDKDANGPEVVDKYAEELIALREYTNTCLKKIGKRYKCGMRVINDDWRMPAYNNAY